MLGGSPAKAAPDLAPKPGVDPKVAPSAAAGRGETVREEAGSKMEKSAGKSAGNGASVDSSASVGGGADSRDGSLLCVLIQLFSVE
eukprot:4696135-Pleurochrysis_carterae.AAC.1